MFVFLGFGSLVSSVQVNLSHLFHSCKINNECFVFNNGQKEFCLQYILEPVLSYVDLSKGEINQYFYFYQSIFSRLRARIQFPAISFMTNYPSLPPPL